MTRRFSVSCSQCAFVATTNNAALDHMWANPTHALTGEGPEPRATLTYTTEED